MARRRRPPAVRLERQLALAAWLASEFGYDSPRDLHDDARGSGEGFDSSSGMSRLALRLLSRGDRLRVGADRLAEYDRLVREHLRDMNRARSAHGAAPITLRPFQHLAALATEHYLSFRAASRARLLHSLNLFVEDQWITTFDTCRRFPRFEDPDLDRLAFWMATGSGKTLLLHLHFRQFLHYEREVPDNILLITPNEGLSAQHIKDARQSGIFAHRVGEAAAFARNPLQVIEITKLAETKQGAGATVALDAFEGHNLIFVDEGHKGGTKEAGWRKVRDALAETGFTFEYSATFGQALAPKKDDDLTRRYGKSILIDYSYRWFYRDGYGKDFRILNIATPGGAQVDERATNTLLLGNLLAFYEQRLAYDRGGEALRPYRIAPPLWVFVGGTVNAVYRKDKREQSDVLTVCRFLDFFLRERAWAEATIRVVMEGRAGSELGLISDPFDSRFSLLRARKRKVSALYDDVLRAVFGSETSGGLQMRKIRGRDGEIGLQAAGAPDYFGVIYVGDASKLLKLAWAMTPELVGPEEAIADPLFASINRPDSPIRVLIGAKRFMEGWNSWRVSCMGLLNIGRTEGSQIIQLFGRGIRLRGRDFSMKRSQPHAPRPPDLPLLETLNIFAVRASYMAKFRKYLRAEGVSEPVPLRLPVRIRRDLLDQGLVVPRIDTRITFVSAAGAFPVEADESSQVTLDVTPHLAGMASERSDGFSERQESGSEPEPIPSESLDLVDWEEARLEVLEHAQARGYRAAVVREADLRQAAASTCLLAAAPDILRPKGPEDRDRLQEAVAALLRKLMDRQWRRRQEGWKASRMTYVPLTQRDGTLTFGRDEGEGGDQPSITVAVHAEDASAAIKRLDSIRTEISDPGRQGLRRLRVIEFDRHLYEPLLASASSDPNGWTASPPPLNEHEARFVEDLRDFCNGGRLGTDTELFLLRNLSRGAGIGFFQGSGFYPDFILWLVARGRQHIIFIEPHGMRHAPAYRNDDKARLHERLPGIAQAAAGRSGMSGITLDSYVISVTPFKDLRPNYDSGDWTLERFASKHILFFPEPGERCWPYLERILRDQLGTV